jgi:hypothetical protein
MTAVPLPVRFVGPSDLCVSAMLGHRIADMAGN